MRALQGTEVVGELATGAQALQSARLSCICGEMQSNWSFPSTAEVITAYYWDTFPIAVGTDEYHQAGPKIDTISVLKLTTLSQVLTCPTFWKFIIIVMLTSWCQMCWKVWYWSSFTSGLPHIKIWWGVSKQKQNEEDSMQRIACFQINCQRIKNLQMFIYQH